MLTAYFGSTLIKRLSDLIQNNHARRRRLSLNRDTREVADFVLLPGQPVSTLHPLPQAKEGKPKLALFPSN